ncbi:hypothetical protein C8N32_1562 [Rhodovulum imhoffii]|uniref:Uncharacterized protein n=2 Tax=Rhodovulum imhoffii TaxID=365340 RepID=A0A2T5B2V5_9RHOB|nr:hypothetical protein C8N32_1562 [Rhodovulum imhoffii]
MELQPVKLNRRAAVTALTNRMVFFKSFSFNIGWKEQNREASIFSRVPKPHWLKRPGSLL